MRCIVTLCEEDLPGSNHWRNDRDISNYCGAEDDKTCLIGEEKSLGLMMKMITT